MQKKTLLSFTITYRRPEEIAEVEALSKEIGKTFHQCAIYLMGLKNAASMLRKAKGLVK